MTPEAAGDKYMPSPRVFISYSWTSDEHSAWVMDLASRLRQDGVETILDRWHLKPGQDKYEFMEQMVRDPTIQKVLMVCDSRYAEGADGRKGGVGDETQIITPEVYSAADQTKFLPLIAERDERGNPYKPLYLKARIHIDLSDPLTFEQGYEDLIRDIAGKPLHTPPPVGKLPSFLQEGAKTPPPTTHKLSLFRHALLAGKPTAPGLAEDYLDQLVQEMHQFNIKKCCQEGLTLGQNIQKCLDDALPYRDEYVDFLLLVTQYGSDPRLFAALPRFFAKALHFIFCHTNGDAESGTYETYRLLVPELFLYTVAALLKREHYEAVNDILARRYQGDGGRSNLRVPPVNYVMFNAYLPTLEEGPRPLSFSKPKPTARIVYERATRSDITALDIVDADYVLYARNLLNPDPSDPYSLSWEPNLRLYFNHNAALPFFVSIQAGTVFERAKVVLNVRDKPDLLQKMEAAAAHADPRSFRFGQAPLSRDRVLMGVDEIDTV